MRAMRDGAQGDVADPRLRFLAEEIGLAIEAYKPDQILRRLAGFMRLNGLSSLDQLKAEMRRDPEWRRRVYHHVTIHVTAFFRDPEYWDRLRTLIARSAPRPTWRVWSAAASNGAEALTIAMLFGELKLDVTILATDADPEILGSAREGFYRMEDLSGLSLSLQKRFFDAAEGGARVQPGLKRRVTYRVLDLLKDPYPTTPFDLIVCRNVLIYFHAPDRERIVGQLAGRLVPGGILFLGSTEVLLKPDAAGLTPELPSLYRYQPSPLATPTSGMR
jgi:chemotaxis protein methyltransferase CheR